MKLNSSTFLRAALCSLALATALNVQFAAAQGTAINYQGRLNTNGAAASGIYDFRFTVYDAPFNGTAQGGTITNSGVAVAGGLFNVTVDFGAGVFTGAPRWLEVGVRTNATGSFTNLSPRDALLPTPYAILAATASNVVAGSAVKSLNGLKDNIVLQPGSNMTLTTNGNTLTLSSSGGGGGSSPWSVLSSNTFYNAGNVGIGTTTPTASLDVRGSLTLETGGSATLFTGTGSSELSRYLNIINSPGFPSASGLKAGGLLVADTFSYASPGKNDAIVKGKLGVGEASPLATLDVFGNWDGDNGALTLRGDKPSLRFRGSFVSGDTSWLVHLGSAPAGNLIFFTRNDLAPQPTWASVMALSTDGRVGIGTITPQALLDVNGTTRTKVLTITGGADVAEPFPLMEEHLEPGSVVVIDDEHAGHLRLSDRKYDARVAGIISGANGIHAGISLQQEGAMAGGQNVALSGRVYVQADATLAAIKPGDLLTTSETPGHAMKVTDHARAQGAILGKAMSSLPNGKGLVLVLVTLQ